MAHKEEISRKQRKINKEKKRRLVKSASTVIFFVATKE